ncbi:hypothetical protein POX_d04935 [Penicillium oxalicum]|uniref:hypothetical protein n=1 Tax=Penicillium oxalicum TaxID=69781 RepID=UPI0020B7C63E|nr:hypothetical protein POX_d04935 [Penicillium oxalicum]KAI2789446.1 hypothetical protein POX_d04935 [Penicillium oxalicum]
MFPGMMVRCPTIALLCVPLSSQHDCFFFFVFHMYLIPPFLLLVFPLGVKSHGKATCLFYLGLQFRVRLLMMLHCVDFSHIFASSSPSAFRFSWNEVPIWTNAALSFSCD